MAAFLMLGQFLIMDVMFQLIVILAMIGSVGGVVVFFMRNKGKENR
ncbi:hypothetical protein [Thalassobacillus hwangdonensis]|uniref:Uncharacterized protein n=1 Tax=Thalassobacillus hwangdonensis TaxID=546108 RepID=A0ABW3L4H6_9BACI